MILHTGGAVGADYCFARNALAVGCSVVVHSFDGHNVSADGIDSSDNFHIVRHSDDELAKIAFPVYEKANRILGRAFPYKTYVRNLILRDYFQVCDSEYVFAVAPLQDSLRVNGGTGYAVEIAIERKIPVVLFDEARGWHYFSYKHGRFVVIDHEPPVGFALTLRKNSITGIGSRKIGASGISAISSLFGVS